MDWNQILNWRLLAGSHGFPGPDGGTCINEAAIVAAGFEYKRVSSWRDCPPCFSPVIAAYALSINDPMPDGLRQELLLPFVTRLAGTTDVIEVEVQRAQYIVTQTSELIIAPGLKSSVTSSPGVFARHAEKAICDAFIFANAAVELTVDAIAQAALAASISAQAALAASLSAHAAQDVAYEVGCPRSTEIFTIMTEILDGAIKLGKQAEPVEVEALKKRMEFAKLGQLVPA
jgi:hypothetical protein